MLGAEEDGFALEHFDGEEEGRAGKHGCKGGNDNDKGHGGEVALGFLVSFGEQGDGHQNGRKKNGNGEGHEENGNDRLGSELEEKTCRRGAPACSLSSVVA